MFTHYRLKHTNSKTTALPCFFENCVATFRNLSSLSSHLSRCHKQENRQLEKNQTFETSEKLFKCSVCHQLSGSIKGLLSHLRDHLKHHIPITCPFKPCNFESRNVKIFNLHLHRKHFSQHDNVKEELILNRENVEPGLNNQDDGGCTSDVYGLTNVETEIGIHGDDYQKCLLERSSLLLLEVEAICKVPSSTVQKLLSGLQEIHHLSSPAIYDSVKQVTDKFGLNSDIAKEITQKIGADYPFVKYITPRPISQSGQLATPYLRKKLVQNSLPFVKHRDIALGTRNGKQCSFTYIPVLGMLQRLLNKNDILKYILETEVSADSVYTCYKDGAFYKKNSFCQEHENPILIGLYSDDFEVCNPLGTSHKIHKICAFYIGF